MPTTGDIGVSLNPRERGCRVGTGLALCIAGMVAALILGGGTRPGFLGDLVLQLTAIPVLAFAVWRHTQIPASRRVVSVLLAALAVVLVPALQLIPLPGGIWTSLPNRSMVADVFELSGQPRPALPISVTPVETWRAAMSLIPTLAIFLCTLLLTYAERRRLSLAVIAVGVASIVLGLLQVGQGPASPLRLFAFTSSDDAVGFFANRNHFAAFIYSITMLLGAWMVTLMAVPEAGRRGKSKDSSWILYLLIALTVFATLIATQAMTRSRAGIVLMLVAIAAVIAMSNAQRSNESAQGSTRIVVAVSAFGLFLIAQYALFATLERFTGTDPLKDGRIAIARNTIEAAKSFMPWGSGVGSFVSVYPSYEKIQDVMRDTYVNRAHNDLLEIWLETGVVGPLLLVGFTIWLGVRTARLWRGQAWAGHHIDLLLARAACIILFLLLAHSFVDYPLRTGAMMALAGYCCALLVPPILGTEQEGVDAVIAATVKAKRPSSKAAISPVDLAPPEASRYSRRIVAAAVVAGGGPSTVDTAAPKVGPTQTPQAWPEAKWPVVDATSDNTATETRERKHSAEWTEPTGSPRQVPAAAEPASTGDTWPDNWLQPVDNTTRPSVQPRIHGKTPKDRRQKGETEKP